MSTEINISGAGNQDKKNFYTDQDGKFYFNALYDKLPTIPGQFSDAGRIVEVTDWETGQQLYGNAIDGLDFGVSNYRPPLPAGVNELASGNLSPGDLFAIKQSAVDPEPLDIAAMNLAAEKQTAAQTNVNNVGEQVQQSKTSRSENANAITPELAEPPATDNTAPSQTSNITEGRITGQNTNAIQAPLSNQLIPEGGDEYAIVGGETDRGEIAAGETGDTFTTNKDSGEVDGDEWYPGMNDGQFGSTTGSGQAASSTAGDSQSGTASPLPSQFFEKITPRPNPLKQYATYTYNVSLYLVNKAGLENLQQGKKTVEGLPLILQSGGASNKTTNDPTLYGAKRSPYFGLDYYIDDIELEGIVTGTSTQSVHNQHTIRFTITEPNGMTFLDNLHKATKDYNTQLGFPENKINYASQMYLMVIRFQGSQIDGIPESLSEMQGTKAEYSEKYIPFLFTNVRFRLENNKIVYHCEARAPMSFYNLNATHAAIPFNVELNGGTVGDVLTANQVTGTSGVESQREEQATQQTQNTNEQKATLYTGLVQALNENSKKAYGEEFANVYRIEFEEGSEIEKKKITLPGPTTNKERTPIRSSKEQPQKGSTDRVKTEQRTKTIQAGTSIVQAIEQIIRGSEYVTAQQTIEVDEVTGKVRQKDETNPQPFQWFKVVMQATPRSDRVNPKTADYAYEIVYKIKRYQVGNPKSPYFPPPIFRGVHKEYKYWFTGENTEVLDFKQDFNYLYFQQATTSLDNLKASPETSMNTVHVTRKFYMPRSTESSEGLGPAGEIAGSVASTLYSPGDLAIATVEILGDPDWISQSEIFYGVNKANNNPFEDDGSVNINASTVYFGIEWNTPADYNDEGLLSPGRYDNQSNDPAIQLCYQANKIVSKLAQGKFTQQIEGTLQQWVNDEFVTRVDRGFTYDANAKRQSTMDTSDDAEWERIDAEQARLEKGIDPNTVTFADDIVAQQNAEFTDDDIVEIGAPTVGTVQGDDILFNQGPVVAPTETNLVGTDPQARNATEPTLTPNSTFVDNPESVTRNTNPNTATQNSITKTGGDRTITQSPLVEPTPVQPAYSGPGYTENESNLTLPAGTTNSGVDSNGQIYGNYKGQEILGGTQGAIDAQKRAIDTGQETIYEDIEYGLTAGDAERVRRKFDPVSGTGEIVGYFNNKTGRWEDAFGNAIN